MEAGEIGGDGWFGAGHQWGTEEQDHGPSDRATAGAREGEGEEEEEVEEAENMRLKLINVVEKSSPILSTQQKQDRNGCQFYL